MKSSAAKRHKFWPSAVRLLAYAAIMGLGGLNNSAAQWIFLVLGLIAIGYELWLIFPKGLEGSPRERVLIREYHRRKKSHEEWTPRELLQLVRTVANDGKLYNYRYHKIALAITVLVPASVLFAITILGWLISGPTNKWVGIIGLMVVGVVLLWIMSKSSATKGAPTLWLRPSSRPW